MKTFIIVIVTTLGLLVVCAILWTLASVIGSHEQSIIGLKKSISEQELDRVMPSLKIVPHTAGPVSL